MVLDLWEGVCNVDIPFGAEYFVFSYPLHSDQLWDICVHQLIQKIEFSFWGGLRDVLTCDYNSKSRGVSLVLYSITESITD